MRHPRSPQTVSQAAARRDAQRAVSRSVQISVVGGAAVVSLLVGAVTSLNARVSSNAAPMQTTGNQTSGSQGTGSGSTSSSGSSGTTSGAQVSPGNGGAQHAKTRGS